MTLIAGRLDMDKNPGDEIVITALLERFTEHRLPRAMDLKKKVFNGAVLDNSDITFLDTIFKDAQYILKYSDKYPEYQKIVAQALELYTAITEKALENEKNKPSP